VEKYVQIRYEIKGGFKGEHLLQNVIEQYFLITLRNFEMIVFYARHAMPNTYDSR